MEVFWTMASSSSLDGNVASGGNPSEGTTWTSYKPFDVDKGEDTEKPTTATPSVSSSGSKRDQSARYYIRMFFELSLPYFRESREGRCLFLGLIVLMLLKSAAKIVFSYLARDFWSALGDKDADEFYRVMRSFLVALVLLTPISVMETYLQHVLAELKWRPWMTERILKLYFYNPHRVYYQLEHQGKSGSSSSGSEKEENRTKIPTDPNSNNNNNSGEASESTNYVDNPDQRLAEDVHAFTLSSLSLFLTVANSLIDLTAFSIILYTIEPMLFVSILLFATLGTLATISIGKDLVRLNFQRLSREADFRYALIRIRENAESIAFFRGEATEGKEITTRFDKLVAKLSEVIGVKRNLQFFTQGYYYLTWILPVVVIAPQYMEGLVELGVVQQAASAFGHILDDLSLIISEFEFLSNFAAGIGRLHQFLRAVRDADPDRDDSDPLMGRSSGFCDTTDAAYRGGTDGIFQDPKKSDPLQPSSPKEPYTGKSVDECILLRELPPVSNASGGSAISIRNLSLQTPNVLSDPSSSSSSQNRILISNLDLELKWGQKLLIIGPSGIGKSSLLRAIAGLWKSGSGVIQRAHVSNVYFLPQKPYCPLGSLRDQLLYPYQSNSDSANTSDSSQTTKHLNDNDKDGKVEDSKLLQILEQVDLPDLAKRSGNGDPYRGLDSVLDWGNVLSLGEQQRLAFGRILVHVPRLVILDEATSAMDVPAEAKMYGLLSESTCVSVGHRPTLLKYHDTQLKLHKPGEDRISSNNNIRGNYSIGDIRSTAEGLVASEEVDLFFR